MRTIYVLTNPEDGWDCISDAFGSLESFLENFPERFIDEEEEELLALFSKVETLAQAKKFVRRMGFILHEVTLYD
jgi:hypothetical protein